MLFLFISLYVWLFVLRPAIACTEVEDFVFFSRCVESIIVKRRSDFYLCYDIDDCYQMTIYLLSVIMPSTYLEAVFGLVEKYFFMYIQIFS